MRGYVAMKINVKEVEEFIRQIKSVLSCKLVTDDKDDILEIHVLSDTKRAPKQISRDLQSGLISKFGVEIDYKKISIAQIDDKTIDSQGDRLILKTIEFTSAGVKADVKVALERKEEVFVGETSGVNTINNSPRLIVSATLKAIESYLGVDDNFIVEDFKTVEVGGKEVIVVSVTFVSAYSEQSFVGCAFANRNKNEAVVKATLDAINRRIIKHQG